jgi:hypothetical protein
MFKRFVLPLCLLIQSPALSLPVFPGAVGFGTETVAGRSGQIITVTNLSSNGTGSLREALSIKGPKTIIFAKGGTINLAGKNLVITEPYVTIAGQTAPSPGINLRSGSLLVQTHDVLIQHLRVRVGDETGKELDALTVGKSGSTGSTDVYNVVVDHCSFAWAIDENASISGSGTGRPENVTFSNNIIAEGLFHSVHSKGEHSMGTLVVPGVKNVAIIGNLYAHNNDRNPQVNPDTSSVIANNLIYNPGKRAIYLGEGSGGDPNSPLVTSVLGNRVIAGVNEPTDVVPGVMTVKAPLLKAYQKDNSGLDHSGQVLPLVQNNLNVSFLSTAPISVPDLIVRSASTVESWVLSNAGARPLDRDSVDSRIIKTVKNRNGAIIDSQNEVGGYPVLSATTRNPVLPSNPNGDSDGDGYTNLEEWLQSQSTSLLSKAVTQLRYRVLPRRFQKRSPQFQRRSPAQQSTKVYRSPH